jgi:hypothetical protein
MQHLVMGIGFFKSLLVVVNTPSWIAFELATPGNADPGYKKNGEGGISGFSITFIVYFHEK